MKNKKNYALIIAPVLTFFLIGIFFALNGIFPFGSKTISWCDMNQQTVPLLMDFKDILDGKTSIVYSTGNSGGMNFWGVFLFFIASPLYVAVKFIDKSDIIYFVNILFMIKLSLCALASVAYFKEVHKKLHNYFSILLSIMYALCGYAAMYFQTLVWLDIMALFPILLLGIEKLCLNNKPSLYCISLILIVTINFYLSYMIIIYIMLAVPAFIKIRSKKSERKKIAVSFIWSSLIAMLITSPVWLCSFLQIFSSARGDSTLSGLIYKPLFDNVANKFSVIMCTALCIAVIPFFIRNKLIRKNEVRYNILLIILLTIPIFVDPINKIWHIGSYQSFPLRYGFVVVFTMITLVAHYFENIREYGNTSRGFAYSVIVITAVYILLSVYIVNSKKEILSSYTNTLSIDKKAFKFLFVIFLLGLMIYTICIMLQRKRLFGKRMFCLILFSVFLGEAYTSFSVNIGYAANDGGVLKTSAVLEHDSSGEPLYRTKNEKKYLHVNMLGGLGYNSLAHYTSLTSKDYMFAMKKLGYSSYWMEVGANGGTVFTDAILSVKKSIGAYFDFKSYYDVTELDGDLEIGVSSICSSIGIMSNAMPDECEKLTADKRIDIQRELAERYFGTSKMFYEYEPSFTAGGDFKYKDSKFNAITLNPNDSLCQMRYTIDVKGKQILYFDIFDRLSNDLSEVYYGSAKVYVNGNCITSDYPNQKNNGILTLGEFENTTAEILVVFQKNISVKSFGIFGIDIDVLKDCINNLNNDSGCDFFVNGRKLTSKFNNHKNVKWLYMSIPYDKGLKAFVNGKHTEIYKVNDTFCAVKIENGQNIIELKFIPYGMKFSFLLLFFGIILCFVWRKIGINKICKIITAEKICYLMFIFIITVVYLLPVILRTAVILSELI